MLSVEMHSCLQTRTYLVSSLVADHNEEAPVVRLDTIVDERWDARVELLPHCLWCYEYVLRKEEKLYRRKYIVEYADALKFWDKEKEK